MPPSPPADPAADGPAGGARACPVLTQDVLRGMPLPRPGGGSKDGRGHLLVVGGSAETAGGALLAGIAALRVGAGRVRVATVASAVPALVAAFPEGRIVGLPEDGLGAIDAGPAAERVAELAAAADAVLVGSGALDPDSSGALLECAAGALVGTDGVLVVDAAALPALGRHPEWLRRLHGRGLAIPNASELSTLTDLGPPEGVAEAAAELGAVVASRGAETFIGAPGGEVHVSRYGNGGLATAGSGDVAAGVIAGLAARGATPFAAACWGAALHGLAGERLAERVGAIGFLARELLDELPGLLPA